MAYRLDELKETVDDNWSQEMFGNCIYEVEKQGKIDGKQLYGVLKGLGSIIDYIPSMNKKELIFIADEDGNEAIVPEVYRSYLKDHGCFLASFEDDFPPLLIVRINKEGILGIFYLLYEYGVNNETKTPFINDGAVDIIKNMTQDEIVEMIQKAYIDAKKENKKFRRTRGR
ncbi:MAG: hypothetical protein IKX00_03875 [Bacilli bacterium]|nr:hypothetical protein [Bacilli bacterium]